MSYYVVCNPAATWFVADLRKLGDREGPEKEIYFTGILNKAQVMSLKEAADLLKDPKGRWDTSRIDNWFARDTIRQVQLSLV